MHTPSQQEKRFIERVQSYLSADAPVTFFDIALALKDVEHFPALPEALLEGLLKLYDAPCLTLGAEETLQGFLRQQATVQNLERESGERSLRISDDGQRVRLSQRAPLSIDLPSRRAQGFRWQCLTKLQQANITSTQGSGFTHFVLNFNKAGTFKVVFTEDGPAHAKDSELQRFSLIVLVEEE